MKCDGDRGISGVQKKFKGDVGKNKKGGGPERGAPSKVARAIVVLRGVVHTVPGRNVKSKSS